MKISKTTLAILENFSDINDGIVLRNGNIQMTVSPEIDIMAEAELDESFPEKFGIYDLKLFLRNISTLNDPDLTFNGSVVTMQDDTFNLSFLSCATDLIVSPPEDKKLELKDADVTFDLSASTLAKMMRFSVMNSVPHISVIGKDKELFITVADNANDSSIKVSTRIGEYEGEDFQSTFNADKLKIINDDYTIQLKKKAFAVFTSKTKKLKYFIAMNKEKK